MAYSIGLKNLKKFIPVATALATITSFLAPESAQARLRNSGSPNTGQTFWVYDIDTSVPDLDPNPNAGLFQGAIQNFKYLICTDSYGQLGSFTPCSGNDVESETAFQVGALIASQVTESNEPIGANDNLYVGGVRYDVSLTSTDPMVWHPNNFSIFVENTLPSDPINFLSDLESLFVSSNRGGVLTQLYYPNGSSFTVGIDVTVVDVPEPNATGGLLSAGAIGALLLLKRKKGFTNQEIQNPRLES